MKEKLLTFIFFSFTAVIANEMPAAKEEIIGEWRGYVLNHGEITFMSQVVYKFLPSGTWSIQNGEGTAVCQGWYRIDRDALFLQPLQAVFAKPNAAIKSHWKNRTTFEIPNPIDKSLGMIFIKKESVGKICLDNVIGVWKIKQRNLYTHKTKEAPFLLHLKRDKTYQLKSGGSALPEEWMNGSFEISGEILRLKNKYTGTGFWNSPFFFFLDGMLRYNNSQFCLWCERIED